MSIEFLRVCGLENKKIEIDIKSPIYTEKEACADNARDHIKANE